MPTLLKIQHSHMPEERSAQNVFVPVRKPKNPRIRGSSLLHTPHQLEICLLYTSDAADDMQCVDLGGRRIIKKNLSWLRTPGDTRGGGG